MTAIRVIGPYILRDIMNAERSLQMLEDYVWYRIWLGKYRRTCFQARWRIATLYTERTCLVGSEVSETKITSRIACKKFRSHALRLFFCGAGQRNRCTGQKLVQWNNWKTLFGMITPTSYTTSCRRLDSIPGRLRQLVDTAVTYIKF
jgi:hypothetical protein